MITEIPKLLPLSSTSLSESSSFRSLCSISAGDKPLFFEWSKNGLLLSNNPQSSYKIDNSEEFSQFFLKSVERSDSGNYSCRVKNAFGEDIKYLQLLVKGF